jgi:DNA-binding NarL/FixJ family response regulator
MTGPEVLRDRAETARRRRNRAHHVRARRRSHTRTRLGRDVRVPDAPTVVVASDLAPARAGLRHALEHHGFTVVAEAADARDAMAAAVALRPGLFLLDMRPPGVGTHLAARISQAAPEVRIAVLAATANHDEELNAISAGAGGYFLRSVAPDRLAVALRSLLAGEIVMPSGPVVGSDRQVQALSQGRQFYRRVRAGVTPSTAWLNARQWMGGYTLSRVR